MLYIDNDTLITLAELDIIDLLCPSLLEDHAEYNVFVLRTCSDFVRDQVAPPAKNRALEFLESTGPISENYLQEEYQELKKIENVDIEAKLYACCANDVPSSILSGDLKAVRAIAHNASTDTISKLQGRVFTTEQCILKIILHAGYGTVSARWADADVDHNFFSSLIGQTETTVIQLIEDRLNGLSQQMKDLIAWP